MKKFPVISDELLALLENAFPDKTPRDTTITPVELGVQIGQQKVLDTLRHHHKQQNILEG